MTKEDVSLNTFLSKFDDLVKRINVNIVAEDPEFNANDIFSETVSQEGHFDSQIKSQVKDFLIILQKVKFPGNTLQYSRITETMFNNNQEFDGVEIVSQRLLDITEKHYKHMLDEDESLEKRFYKLIDHIELASFQIGEISQHFREETNSLVKEIYESKEKLIEVEKEVNNKNAQFENISEEISKIYTQFVTILGIFTAIVISVFGGLSIVNGVFSRIDETPVWKIVLVGSVVSIAIISMLFLLTSWISSIIHKPSDNDEHSFMRSITNNGAFTTGIFIFCYLIIASVAFSSEKTTTKLKQLFNIWDSLFILAILIIPILVPILFGIYKLIKELINNKIDRP